MIFETSADVPFKMGQLTFCRLALAAVTSFFAARVFSLPSIMKV
tara:strand:- start:116 stop:247 length:132 start_codon:yes stop_codon:yes gene_type:complete